MFRFLFALTVALLGFVNVAEAQFKTKTTINPPGLFNRTTVTTRSNGNFNNNGFNNHHHGNNFNNNGFRGNNFHGSNFHGNNFHGSNFNGVRFNSSGFHNHGFPVNNFSAVAFNGRHGSVGFGVPGNVGFDGRQVVFVNQNKVRFNSFGVSTQQDAFGNVFEIDAFGNARFVGNRLGSSATITGFVPASVGVGFHTGSRSFGY